MVSIADWKYSKTWAYSITYDEALAELHQFVVPAHKDTGIPGHVEVVAGHMGLIRKIGESSFNGMKHMSAEELKELLELGWGVGSHSWSHELVMDDPELELKKSREVLSDALGYDITVYTAPGSNVNLTPEVQEKIWEYGYLCGLSITDDINRPNDSLLYGNRVTLHDIIPGYYDGAYDAFKRISQAKREKGWIVDYCHCPLKEVVCAVKDVSAAHHRERLETIASEGSVDCWFANPDVVTDYRYMRKYCKITNVPSYPNDFTVALEGLPANIRCRELTFEISTFLTPDVLDIRVDDKQQSVTLSRSGILSFTTSVKDKSVISIKTIFPWKRY